MVGTRISYLYRDASNYKFRSDILVSGVISRDDVSPYLIDGEFFIPKKVQVCGLAPDQINEDDHDLHELEGFACVEISESQLDAKELVSRFRVAAAEGWFRD